MGVLISTFLVARRTPRGAADQPMPRLLLGALVFATFSFIAANSFSPAITGVMAMVKWVALVVLTVVALLSFSSLPDKPRAPPLTSLLLAMFGLVIFAGMLVSTDPLRSLMAGGMLVSSWIAAYCLSAVLVATDSRRAYFDLLAVCGRIVLIFTVPFLLLGINLGRGGGTMGVNAWTDNANTLALILAPGAVVFFAGCMAREPGWIFKHALFLALAIVLILKSDSRATGVWLVMSFGAFWVYRRGFTMVALITIVLAIGATLWWETILDFIADTLVLFPKQGSTKAGPLSGREEVWALGWDFFKSRPLTGYGIGSSEEIVRAQEWRFYRHQGLHFHNSYLSVLVEIGLPGLIAFGTAMILTIGNGLKDSARTRRLPRESWIYSALPLSLVMGAAGHAVFESWLTFPGNANMLQFWIWFWLIHHQTQIQVRPAPPATAPQAPGHAAVGAALPAQ